MVLIPASKRLRARLLSSLLLAGVAGGAAFAALPTDYDVKAAYLYNFAKFVEWPASSFEKSGGRFVIGVVGEDPFTPDLGTLLAGKAIQDRPIVVEHFNSLQEAANCQLLFIGPAAGSGVEKGLEALAQKPVLTVSDSRVSSSEAA